MKILVNPFCNNQSQIFFYRRRLDQWKWHWLQQGLQYLNPTVFNSSILISLPIHFPEKNGMPTYQTGWHHISNRISSLASQMNGPARVGNLEC